MPQAGPAFSNYPAVLGCPWQKQVTGKKQDKPVLIVLQF